MGSVDTARLWSLLSEGEHSVRIGADIERAWVDLMRRVCPELDAGDIRARFLDRFDAAAHAGDLRLHLRTATEIPLVDLAGWQLLPSAIGGVLLAAGEPQLEVAALIAETAEAVLAAAMHENGSPCAARLPRIGGAPVPETWREFHGLVGSSPVMRALHTTLLRAAHDHQPVLIFGETGAGKEVAARAIHALTQTRHAFVPVNCAALPSELVETELFGHLRGAFTGAVYASEGLFVEASGGTILLDEVTEVPLAVQSKILRVVQDGLVRAVGASTHRRVNARVMATTNRDPIEAVQAGVLRRDLYYRLAVHRIEVPPLRAHREDIPELVAHFVQQWQADAPGLLPPRIASDALAALCAAAWPGNVRELQHTVLRIASQCPGEEVHAAEVEAALDPGNRAPSSGDAADPGELRSLAQTEREAIERALRGTGGNKAAAARLLGVTRKTLYHKLLVYGLSLPDR